MALHITNPAVVEKVREMASVTGESITDAIGVAVDERMTRMNARRGKRTNPTVDDILTLVRSFGLKPINQDLTEDEILGYGPNGFSE